MLKQLLSWDLGGGGAPDLGEVNGNAAAGVEALVKGGMTEVAAAGLIGNMTPNLV